MSVNSVYEREFSVITSLENINEKLHTFMNKLFSLNYQRKQRMYLPAANVRPDKNEEALLYKTFKLGLN